MAQFGKIETAENHLEGTVTSLLERTRANGGGTFKVTYDVLRLDFYDMAGVSILEDYRGTDVWVVGGAGFTTVATPDRERAAVVDAVMSQIPMGSVSGEFFMGTWIDPMTGDLHVDIVDFYHNKSDALETARVRGELAIFNLATEETVDLADVSV